MNFLQVAAFKSQESANRLKAELVLMTSQSVLVRLSDAGDVFRVQIGPLLAMDTVQEVSAQLVALGKGQPQLIAP